MPSCVSVLQNSLLRIIYARFGSETHYSFPVLNSQISFYGAYYKDGKISIALELMDGGSMADVLQKVKTYPEGALAVITRQANTYALSQRHTHLHTDKRVLLQSLTRGVPIGH